VALIWGVFLLWLGEATAWSQPDSFAHCEAQVVTAPQARETWKCFYLAARQTGNYEAATVRLEEAVAKWPDAPWLHLSLGNLKGDQGLMDETSLWYQRARDGFAESKEARGEVYACVNWALHLNNASRYDDADAELERALKVASASGDHDLSQTVRVQYARVFNRRGVNLGKAYQTLKELEEEVFPDGDYQLRLVILNGLANLCFKTGRNDEGLSYLIRQIAITEEQGDLYAEASSRTAMIGNLIPPEPELMERFLATDLPSFAQKALVVAQKSGSSYSVASAHCSLGQVLRTEDRFDHFQRCIDIYEDLEDLEGMVLAALQMAWAVGEEDPAKALALLDDIEAMESPLAAAAAEIAACRSAFLWVSNRQKEALNAGWQAMALVEGIREAQGADVVRSGFLATWSGFHYEFAHQLLESGATEPAYQAVEQLRGRAMLDALDAANVRGGDKTIPTPALREVQGQLASNEAIVAYQSATVWVDHVPPSWVLLITADEVQTVPLVDRKELQAKIDLYTGLLDRRDSSDSAAARVLFDLVLQPVVEILPEHIGQLYIVPDGPLHGLPFDALKDGNDRLAAEAFDIVLAPSITLWSHWRQNRPSVAPAVLVIADPEIDTKTTGLGRLPGARREAKGISHSMGKLALIRQGSEAGESWFKGEDLSQYGVVHFGTHAIVDHLYPDQSAVLLASDANEDGWLRVREIAELKLNDQVVVLAACHSASGRVLGGEGPIGLARGFFRAGAVVVVGSLWPLRDDDAAILFRAFYAHLAQGKSVQGALAAAKGERLAQGAPAEAWAGVVVIGKGDVVPIPGGIQSFPWWMVGLGLTVCLAGGGAMVWRKSSN
jgi:CHAT domain-containing protein/tetratricopeptide (TPR) repeat protein